MVGDQPDLDDDDPSDLFWNQYAYRVLASAAVAILAIGTVVYQELEDWSWVDSFYFSSVAVTTVGFGDLSPTTDGSKLFTVLYIFSGIALISLFINEVLKRQARKAARRRSDRRSRRRGEATDE